jgi:pyruvate dehydrogenase E1 component
MIAEYVAARFMTLGTDGFGRSDTRGRLRRFFEVDRYSITLAALQALSMEGTIEAGLIEKARQRYMPECCIRAPWER